MALASRIAAPRARRPPAARFSHSMATLGNTVVLTGGISGTGPMDDTWTWDGNTWTEITGPKPPTREGAALAPLGNKLVMFGGRAASNHRP